MGKPILYGTILSPPVRTVLLTSKAIGLDIDFKEISLADGDHKTEDYLKKNPQHTVPLLDDNGKCVWDSHAIATYLIGKYGKDDTLYPKDLFERARIDQRLHFESGVLFPVLKDIVVRMLYLNIPEIEQRSIDKVNEAYGFLEAFLKESPYLTGDTLTVADFSCAATTTSLNIFVPIDASKYPGVLKWLECLSKLPYWATNQEGIDKFVASQAARKKNT